MSKFDASGGKMGESERTTCLSVRVTRKKGGEKPNV
jgi:hypothetical protein